MLGEDGKPILETKEVTRVTGFKRAAVFDISQTYILDKTKNDPLKLGVDQLEGNVENYNNLLKALEETSPVPIFFAPIESNAKGYFNYTDNKIIIKEGMEQLQTIKTLIHEIAHATIHNIEALKSSNNPPSKEAKEVQAESIAYVVATKYSLDTSDYSFAYIIGWSSDENLTEFKESLKIIQKTSDKIIGDIDSKFIEYKKYLEPEKTIDKNILEIKEHLDNKVFINEDKEKESIMQSKTNLNTDNSKKQTTRSAFSR